MFNKKLTMIVAALSLTACATAPTTQTTLSSEHTYAQMLLGKWQCQTEYTDSEKQFKVVISSQETFTDNGLNHSIAVYKMGLFNQYMINYQVISEDSWRVEGAKLLLKSNRAPQVKELPPANDAEKNALKTMETILPNFRQEVRADLAKFDTTEDSATITKLTPTELITLVPINDVKTQVPVMCQRVK